jgi:hypothetical protein
VQSARVNPKVKNCRRRRQARRFFLGGGASGGASRVGQLDDRGTPRSRDQLRRLGTLDVRVCGDVSPPAAACALFC